MLNFSVIDTRAVSAAASMALMLLPGAPSLSSAFAWRAILVCLASRRSVRRRWSSGGQGGAVAKPARDGEPKCMLRSPPPRHTYHNDSRGGRDKKELDNMFGRSCCNIRDGEPFGFNKKTRGADITEWHTTRARTSPTPQQTHSSSHVDVSWGSAEEPYEQQVAHTCVVVA